MGAVMKAPGGDISEIARLMEVFNQATEKLSRSYGRIAELQKELAEKDRLLSKKTRLEMLGRMAASLAHEIRNPLGGILLYASMLRRDLGSDPAKVQVVDKILAAVSGLDQLVEDMLAFGRDIDPRRVMTPLAPVLEAALELARVDGRIILEKRLDDGSAMIDPEMIQRVFLNIVLNATQAMESGGRLAVAIEGSSVRFTDSGPGIPREILERIFTPFLTTKVRGTGLGLAIAHKIVEAHGGTIEAKNNPEGGATFVVRL